MSKKWWTVGLLFLGILINYVDRGNLSIVAVPMMREFGISPKAMGILLSAFFWSYSLLQIPAGYVVDRFGLKWTYAGAFLLWSLASAAVGLAESFEQVLAFRVLLGIGEAVAAPASLAYIRQQFREDEQGLPTAIYVSGMMLGPAIGAFFGAVLLEHLGWRQLFVFTGLGGCLWLIPWFLVAPTAKARREVRAAEQPIEWARLFRSPLLWGISVGAFFYSYYWYFYLTWLPSYLVMAHGFSFLKMGAYTAIPLLGMALVATLAGRAADRMISRSGHALRVRKAFVCVGFTAGSSIFLLLLVQSQYAVLATVCFSLLGIGLASANYWALTQAVTPERIIGRVIGYQNTVANAAGVCAPILTGYLLGDGKDFRSSIAFAGGSLLIAAAAYAWMVRERDVKAFQTQSGT